MSYGKRRRKHVSFIAMKVSIATRLVLHLRRACASSQIPKQYRIHSDSESSYLVILLIAH